MIDIVFQLVLFFMVSTTFVTSPGIDVDLPRASTTTMLTEQEDVDVWMTTDGAIHVDQEPVDAAGLRTRLRAAAERDPGTLVILKADTGVPHGRVVQVMDLARAVGLSRIAIATDPGQPSRGEASPDGPPAP
jgi:biopolymer transport protein ExbD